MPEIETPADRLRAAAARVREGWTRGRLINEHGERCALGAILNVQLDTRRTSGTEAVLRAEPTAWEATRVLHRHLRSTDGPHRWHMFFDHWRPVENIEEWNDASPTSADDVAAAMEKAAAAWEENPGATA